VSRIGGPGLALLLLCALAGYGDGDSAPAADDSLTAIDIALEPDATMVARAGLANDRLRSVYPSGFVLDEVHHPHITMLQRFVRTADLDAVYAAADEVFANERLTAWKLNAVKYYYLPSAPDGVAGIVVERTQDLADLQQRLIDAVAPYTEKTGTAAAFASAEQGRDIQQFLIDYVAAFVPDSSGAKFNPHVTIGVGTQVYLDAILAEPFEAFSFSPAGASVYQLGTFGTAQKKLHAVKRNA